MVTHKLYKLNFAILMILFIFVIGCKATDTIHKRIFKTTPGLAYMFTKIEAIPQLDELDSTDTIWGGVVSHHDITAKLLDNYFDYLQETIKKNGQGRIDVFYILSPAHFGITRDYVALTHSAWSCDDGIIETDIEIVDNLSVAFDVELDNDAFEPEHGISTIVPFIKKHFPTARIVPILFDVVNNFSGVKIKKYVEVLAENFLQNKNKNTFLLISSDFSHNADFETTIQRDAKSAQYFTMPNDERWHMVSCDNAPAIRTFTKLATNHKSKVVTLYQTNSYILCPELTDPNDITSYFFSYFVF